MSPSTNPRSAMFYDWIKAYQDFPFDLPLQSDIIVRRFDAETEELLGQSAPAFLLRVATALRSVSTYAAVASLSTATPRVLTGWTMFSASPP